PLLPEGTEANRSGCQVRAQIVMRLEEEPRLRIDPANVERDGGPSLKQPPGEGVAVGTVDPIRIEPRLHILMAGDGDELLPALADRLGQGGAADLGHGAIDRGGELIDDR